MTELSSKSTEKEEKMKKLAIFLTAIIAVFSCTAYADLNDGLIAYYPFSGNAADNSGNGNHGTEYGVEYVIGVTGQAVRFDGTDDFIKVKAGKSLNPENQFSIAFWIRADSNPETWFSVISKEGSYINGLANPEYSVSLSSQGVISLASAGDGNAGYSYDTNPVPVNEWIFYTGVINRKNHYVRIYINSILHKENTDSYSSFNNNNEDLKIGWSQVAGSSSLPFRGSLDELRLYNRVISESEIGELYRNGRDSYMREHSNQIWDINNDGRTGLEEAIYALQIAAGIK
jgi:hypothetical protein